MSVTYPPDTEYPTVVTCPNCHNVIGEAVPVRGEWWLRVSGIEARSVHGRCAVCHKFYHYDAGNIKIESVKETCK